MLFLFITGGTIINIFNKLTDNNNNNSNNISKSYYQDSVYTNV